MAYGKIKADTITYDNSGTDVDTTIASLVSKEGTAIQSTGESGTTKFLRTDGDGTCSWQVPDISSKADLSGATFTGDVTFDGQTAGRDVVWDKSRDALTFKNNAYAEFGDTAQIQVYHSGSGNGYIKNSTGWMVTNSDQISLATAANNYMGRFESASVGLYSGGTERIQANSTGAAVTGALTVSTNLTVTGDLTVNGTTTTVNTATLEVEDKNIELGKVSTPSDTTADGGGITLKGATDKTFNWVDATDAWTSSEHIHLGDTPKLLLGTDQDAEINHNGSNLFIQNTTGNININPKANETSILCVPDGGVELYYDNVKTFETVSNGIQVNGTEGQPAYIYMYADEGDDNADKWIHAAENNGTFAIKNYSSGSWVQKLGIDGSGNITGAGTVSDSKGDLRLIPANNQSSAYTLTTSDIGKHVSISSGGVTVPQNIGAGAAITIINNSGSDQTITQDSGVTMYNTADASTGNRTLAGRGMATILFVGNTDCYISGAGLS